jgi:iron complex outermembrane receptor protein
MQSVNTAPSRFFRTCCLFVSVFSFVVGLSAAEPTKSYSIPAGPAETTLKSFADQSGRSVIFSGEKVRGIQTNEVKGELTAEGALDRLLAGTKLSAVPEKSTGGFAVRREASVEIAEKNASSRPGDNRAAPESGLNREKVSKLNEEGVLVLEAFTVTGTNIRGAMPVGAPLRIYDSEEIRRRGVSTTEQLMRQLPENAATYDSSTSSSGYLATADAARTNNNVRGTQVNLHGVGAGATLVLMDGNRLAPAGSDGSMVDASVIPLSAVERVEILTEGASAIYGADAVAGVVNFVTKKDYSGVNTSVRYGDTTDGGGREVAASVTGGRSWGTGNALVTYEYYDLNPVLLTQRESLSLPSTFSETTILPSQLRHSLLGLFKHQISQAVELSGSGYFSDRKFRDSYSSSAVGNTTSNGAISNWGANIGGKYTMGKSWSVALAGAFSRTATDFYSRLDLGTVTSLAHGRIKSRVDTVDLRADGALIELPGGELRAAFGVHNRQEFYSSVSTVDTSTLLPFGDARDRTVNSAFGELFIPIIGVANRNKVVKRMQLSTAARYDSYSDDSASINPKFGTSVEVAGGLKLRASVARSFRAPPLSNKAFVPTILVGRNFPDPDSSTGSSNVIIDNSNANPSLHAERSRSVTAGFDITPALVKNFRISATWYQIEYTDRIARPPVQLTISRVLQQKATLAPFLNLAPTQSQILAYYNSPGFVSTTVPPTSIGAIFDNRLQNLARTTVEGFDLSASYSFAAFGGNVLADASLAKYNRNSLQAAETTAEVSAIDVVYRPTDIKLHGRVGWANQRLSVNVAINYVDDYSNTLVTPTQRIASWHTFDLNGSYRFGKDSANGKTTLGVFIANIGDRSPPRLAIPPNARLANYDAINASPRGRFISVQITREW